MVGTEGDQQANMTTCKHQQTSGAFFLHVYMSDYVYITVVFLLNGKPLWVWTSRQHSVLSGLGTHVRTLY